MGVFTDRLWASASDVAMRGAVEFIEQYVDASSITADQRKRLESAITDRISKQQIRMNDEVKASLARGCSLNQTTDAFHDVCRMCGRAAARSVFGISNGLLKKSSPNLSKRATGQRFGL